MKNLFLFLFISTISFSILSFTDIENTALMPSPDGEGAFVIPTDVQSIIDKSCYGCHNSESSSTKAKMKLNFDNLPSMKTGKQVGKLMKISKVISKGDMPTEKFLKNYPERALTEEDKTNLTSWADGLAQELGGE